MAGNVDGADFDRWTATVQPLHDLVRGKATELGLDPGIALSLVHQESGFKPQAVSPTGVTGLAQVTIPTGLPYGQTPDTRTDPAVSTHAGLSYFKDLLGQSGGNVRQALTRYNGGSDPQFADNVLRHLPLYASTAEAASPPGPRGGLDVADFDRWMSTQQPAAAPPASGTRVPPTAPPEAAVGPGTGGTQMTIDIAKPSAGNPPGEVQRIPETQWDELLGRAGTSPPAPSGPQATSVPLTPGMTGEQVAKAYGYDPAQFTKEQLTYLPRVVEEADPLLFGADPGSFTGRALHGLWSNVHGAMQLVDRGLLKAGIVPQGEVAYSELLAKIDATKYAKAAKPETHEYPIIGDPAKLVGDVAFGAMIPGLGAAGRGVQGFARSAATGAAFGAAQPIIDTSPTPGASGDPFAAQKLQQTTMGAVAGPAVEYGVVRPLMWGVNKAINATRGVFSRAEDAAVLDLAAAHGVEPTYADVRGAMQAPSASRTEVNLERFPGSGAGRIRQTQQRQATAAAEAFQQHYVGEVGQAQYSALPGAQQLAARGDRQAARAVALAQQAGNDPGKIMQASADLNLQTLRGRANELYFQVQQLAAPLGDVPPTRSLAQAYAAMDAVEQATIPIDPTGATKGHLERILTRFEPTTSPPNQFGQTTTTTPPTPYAVMDKISNDLGTLLRQPHMRDTYGATLLSAVKQAVDEDMRQFALSSSAPGLAQAKLAADTFYPQVVRQRDLVRSIEDMPSDELTRHMFQPRRGERAEQWFNALDAKGQAAARAEILTQALYDGTTPAMHPTTGRFSPAQMAGNLERLRDVTGVTFPKGGELRWQVDGFTKLMRHIERAGQYAENPPTGQRLMTWLQAPQAIAGATFGALTGGAPGALAGSLVPLAAEAATGRLAKVLLMNPGGRNILLAAHNLRPGSPAMQRLVNDLAQRLPALAGQIAGQEPGGAAPPSGR